MTKYPNLFSSIRVGNITLKNRIVMAPMDTCYTSNDGTLTPKGCAYYLERARGGAGLIILEAIAVDWPYGKGSRRQPRMNNQVVTPEWSDLIPSVHSFGAKIICQVNHNGFKAVRPNNYFAENVTASQSPYSEQFPARPLTVAEIDEYVHKYETAAEVIKTCEFDGIEIHAAHTYLLNEFLSPLTNFRKDEYGGSLENRARFLLRIIRAVRKVIGPQLILSVRLAVIEEIEGGITPEEGALLAKMSEEAGADMINCTSGFTARLDESSGVECYFTTEGRRIFYGATVKPSLEKACVAVVGKLRSPAMCEQAIADSSTDLVCLGRQLLADPYWPIKAQMGREAEIRKCLSCNEGCFSQFRPKGGSIRCVLNPYTGFEYLCTETLPGFAQNPRKLLIVGGGIGGMQAAIIAKKRGHDVTLVEQTGALGGQMVLAGIPPHKSVILEALNWFVGEVGRLNINVQLNTTVDEAYIERVKPDVVLLAIGSQPSRPPVKGIDAAADVWDVLRNAENAPEGKNIVVIGGGTVGCETAEMLIEKGNHVTIIEMLDEICIGQELTHKAYLEQVLRNAGTDIFLRAKVQAITADSVTYLDAEGKERTVACDMVIVATGQKPKDPGFVDRLLEKGILAYTIADAIAAGNFRFATRSAMDIVMTL